MPLNRREFLQSLGIIAAGYPAEQVSRHISRIIPRQERRTPPELSLPQAFRSPLALIDAFCDKLQVIPHASAQEFVNLFSDHPQEQFKDQAQYNRMVIDTLYRENEYGEILQSLYQRATDLDITHYFPHCEDWWVISKLFLMHQESGAYAGWAYKEITAALLRIIEVGESLGINSSYESQKSRLLKNAQQHKGEIELTDKAKQYTGIQTFIDTLSTYVPASLFPFVKSFDVNQGEDQYSRFFRGASIVRLNSSHSYGLASPYNLRQNAYGMTTKIALHEVSHAVDIKYVGMSAPVHETLHPLDTFAYSEGYVDMFEDFYSSLDTLPEDDLKIMLTHWWMMPAKFSQFEFVSNDKATFLSIQKKISQFSRYMASKEGKQLQIASHTQRLLTYHPSHDSFLYYFAVLRRLVTNGLITPESPWYRLYTDLKVDWIDRSLLHINTGPVSMNLFDSNLKKSELKRAGDVKAQMTNAKIAPPAAQSIYHALYYSPAVLFSTRMHMWGADQTGLIVPGEADPSMSIVRLADKLAVAK